MTQQNATTENPGDGTSIVCYAPTMITINCLLRSNDDYSLPLFILQLTLVVVTTRLLVISEILGGLILGPSVSGRISEFANTIFPLRSVMVVLETMANVGLLYFIFLVGFEIDISVIKRTGKKATAIAITEMILPFLTGFAFSFLLCNDEHRTMNRATFILFLGVALSITALPILARILAELKLINTELSRIAISSALINDICAWILLALAIDWMIKRTPDGESFNEFYICLILTGVMKSTSLHSSLRHHRCFKKKSGEEK